MVKSRLQRWMPFLFRSQNMREKRNFSGDAWNKKSIQSLDLSPIQALLLPACENRKQDLTQALA